MNIFFINPPSDKKRIIRLIDCSHEAKANYLWQPNDYMIMSSLLGNDDKAYLIDGTADRMSKNEFLKRLNQNVEPHLIIYALSSVFWTSDLFYFNEIKKLFPNIPIYVIGDIFLEKEYQDYILGQCEGIISIPHIINFKKMAAKEKNIPGIQTEIDQIIHKNNTPIKVNNFGIPKHDIFLKSGYVFPFAQHKKFTTITSVWGCPFTCSYCTDSKIAPVIRDADSVIKELEYIKKLNIKELFFADKAFGYPYSNAYLILQILKTKFRFSWSCYFHPQLYKQDLLKLMKDAGCHTIIIGIDSQNLDSLKQYKRNVQTKKLEDLIYHANDLKINVCADFILGLEHETEQDVINTVEYSLKLPLDFASFNIAAPLPGSDIRKKAFDDGTMKFGEEGFDTLGFGGVLGNKNIKKDKLIELRDMAVKKFYFRWSYFLRRILRTKSFEHFIIQLKEMIFLFRNVCNREL